MDKFVNSVSDCPALSGWEKSKEHVRLSKQPNSAVYAVELPDEKKTGDISQKTKESEA